MKNANLKRMRQRAALAVIIVGVVNVLTAPDQISIPIEVPPQQVVYSDVPTIRPSKDKLPDVVAVPTQHFTHRDEVCLAKNIYFEAKNQSLAGKLAVGIVTLRRVASSDFPKSVCGVVEQSAKNSRNMPIRNRCQFSWYCDGKPDKVVNEDAYEEATVVASALLSGETSVIDITKGADHYHASYVRRPSWTSKMKRVARVEDHVFYSDAL